jgi:hypothetical protein
MRVVAILISWIAGDQFADGNFVSDTRSIEDRIEEALDLPDRVPHIGYAPLYER